MKKSTKYAITVGIAAAVGLLSFLLLMNKFSMGKSVGLSMIPALLVLLVGVMSIEKHHKENYEGVEAEAGDTCNQTINIYQNCPGPQPGPVPPGPKPPGPKPPGPTPPADKPVTKDDVLSWIKSVDPQLTGPCKNCITDNAVKLWKMSDLNKVKSMPIEKQKSILNAMLVLDCSKQCVVPPSGLDKAAVSEWVLSVDPQILTTCLTCAVDNIMKLWSPEQLAQVKSFDKEKQALVLQGVMALNCPSCATAPKLNKADVEKWLTTVLVGAKPDCYSCTVDTVLKLWSVDQFDKVKAMSKQSQTQVVQALIALNCEKDCVAVPSGLTQQEVEQWLNSVFVGASSQCSSCLVDTVMKNWSLAILNNVKAMPKDQQEKIVEGLIAFNCESSCTSLSDKLTKTDISDWLHSILPDIGQECSGCIVDMAYSMWIESMPTKEEFHKQILTKECSEQVKIAKLVGDFNCPHVCSISPIDPCN